MTKAGYTLERHPTQCHVRLAGDLTASLVPDLQAALRQEIQPDTAEVLFDFEHTTMLDSSGIGLLIATYNTLARRQGRIRLIQVAPDIQQLLQSMRLVGRLEVSGRAGKGGSHE